MWSKKIKQLNFIKFYREEKQQEIFDPYNILIKIENRKDIITKIRSIPMILDKDLFNQKIEGKIFRY